MQTEADTKRDPSLIKPMTVAVFEAIVTKYNLSHDKTDLERSGVSFSIPAQMNLQFAITLSLWTEKKPIADQLRLEIGPFKMEYFFHLYHPNALSKFQAIIEGLIDGTARIIERTYKNETGVEYQLQALEDGKWTLKYMRVQGDTGWMSLVVSGLPFLARWFVAERVFAHQLRQS